MIQKVIEQSGYLSELLAEATDEAEERRRNLQELINAALQYQEENENGDLEGFLATAALASDFDTKDSEANRVTLMTIHASKGLEFPVVFLTGLEDGLFPLYSSLDEKEKLEEERRLFYVGVTRAMKKVYLLYANNRRRIGSDDLYGLVSRFVNEVPEEKLEKISFTSALTRKVVRGKRGRHTRTVVKRTVVIFDDFQVGDYVEHSIFGTGKVQA